jgi:hypothetical protein
LKNRICFDVIAHNDAFCVRSGFGGGGGWPSGVPKPDAHYRANDKKTASKGKDDTNANQDEL